MFRDIDNSLKFFGHGKIYYIFNRHREKDVLGVIIYKEHFLKYKTEQLF